MLDKDWANLLDDGTLVVIEKDLFANSLINATMQDSGKRERSVLYYL